MIIQPTLDFVRDLKKLKKKFPSINKDLNDLKIALLNNPKMGIALGRDCYKIRMAIGSKGKGKSGGARVITFLKIENDIIYLLTIYDKSQTENISDNVIDDLILNI